MVPPALPPADVLIAGAGIIGLSLALELHARGAQVVVMERDTAMSQASVAAAGMLAAHDPHNPPALREFAKYSLSLYPEYLARIEHLSSIHVPYQTDTTVQHGADGTATRIPERSLDPRQIAEALLAAVRRTPIVLREHTGIRCMEEWTRGHYAITATGERVPFSRVIVTAGAWSKTVHGEYGGPEVKPMKGQMLRVRVPAGLDLQEVHRHEDIYIVPRLYGPQAGTALIGATVEDAGFDTSVNAHDLAELRARAAGLVPALASGEDAPLVEAWAGLRPATPDGLPLIGHGTGCGIATGHFRNGILLAPGTAKVVADLFEGKKPAVDLAAFRPDRFPRSQGLARTDASIFDQGW